MQQPTPVSSVWGTLRFAFHRLIVANYVGWITVLVTPIFIDFDSSLDRIGNIFAVLPFCAWFSNQYVWRWSPEDGCMQPSDFWVIAAPVLFGWSFAFLENLKRGTGAMPIHVIYLCIALFFGWLVLQNRRAGAWKDETNQRLGYS